MQKQITVLIMAVTGLLFFAAFVSQDIRVLPDVTWGELPWGLILRYALAMTFGGALAGFLFAGFFGRRGFLGWLLAIIGGVLSALVAGLFGSAIGLLPDLLADGYHTADLVRAGLGVLVIPLSLIEQPALILLLAGLVGLAHVMAKRARRPTI